MPSVPLELRKQLNDVEAPINAQEDQSLSLSTNPQPCSFSATQLERENSRSLRNSYGDQQQVSGFDHSGALTFSVVFGLCRRSPEDRDPVPLRLSTADSILNVPHALYLKLLTLRECHSNPKRG
ncbi:hypothetical protein F5Y15DRAFT_248647 [Xylariaceae sp. FL0016]|nr:hypothetical protein F5Y15DRAFT_248647 [Xylariaceae sp. FL0016]